MISKNEAANRKLSGFDGGISRVKWASVYQCDCGGGFRLSPTCSPIRYGLVFPRGCLFIGIVHDKGRSHQESRSPFLKGSNSVPTRLISRRASEIMEVFEGGCDLKSSEIGIAAEVGDSVVYHSLKEPKVYKLMFPSLLL